MNMCYHQANSSSSQNSYANLCSNNFDKNDKIQQIRIIEETLFRFFYLKFMYFEFFYCIYLK